MDLQQALDHFKVELEAYITKEVARQVAAQMGASSSASSSLPSVRTDVSTASVSENMNEVQSSLDMLADLAASKTRVQKNTVDEIANMGGPTATIEALTQETKSNGDYLKELADAAQGNELSPNQDVIDKLSAMIGEITDETRQELPQVTERPKANASMTGIQSFLNKIRERKNLSSN